MRAHGRLSLSLPHTWPPLAETYDRQPSRGEERARQAERTPSLPCSRRKNGKQRTPVAVQGSSATTKTPTQLSSSSHQPAAPPAASLIPTLALIPAPRPSPRQPPPPKRTGTATTRAKTGRPPDLPTDQAGNAGVIRRFWGHPRNPIQLEALPRDCGQPAEIELKW